MAAVIETSHRSATRLIKPRPAGDFAGNGGCARNLRAYSADQVRSALAGISIAPLTNPARLLLPSSRRPRAITAREATRARTRGLRLFGLDGRCASYKCSRRF